MEIANSIRVQLFISIGWMGERAQVLLRNCRLMTNLEGVIPTLNIAFRRNFSGAYPGDFRFYHWLDAYKTCGNAGRGYSADLSEEFASGTRDIVFRLCCSILTG